MTKVLQPFELQPEWQHLKRFGYAPGDYMSRCICCGEAKGNLDKRAIMCRECAEKRYAEETPDQALQLCRPSVAYDMGKWKRKLKRDLDMPTDQRVEALQRISELRKLLDYIDERRT